LNGDDEHAKLYFSGEQKEVKGAEDSNVINHNHFKKNLGIDLPCIWVEGYF